VFRVSFPGPFSTHDVVVDGWKVPLVHAHPCGESDECVMLVIDNRLAATFSVDEAERFVPFLADAIAVALGYTCLWGTQTRFPAQTCRFQRGRTEFAHPTGSGSGAAACGRPLAIGSA
jgi:hypothetical protein